MKKVIVRSPYNYDREKASMESTYVDDLEAFPDKTIQSGKDDADINVIVKRFNITGQLPPAGRRIPEYGDYNGVSDFQTAMNAVRAAEEAFAALPADLRARFGNNPQAYLEFVTDSKNIDEMERLGIAKRRKVEDTIPEPNGSATKEKDDARSVGKRAGKSAKAFDGPEGGGSQEQSGA